MGTVSNPMQPTAIRHLVLVRKESPRDVYASTEKLCPPVDDGLGCVRGFVAAMFCNLIFAMIIVAGWGLWSLLR
jgi:hypothetical protein